jgi:hypothetical protein
MSNTFTVVRSTAFGGHADKSLAIIEGTLVIDTTASGGGAVDDLPASLFKLKKIVACLGIIPSTELTQYFANGDYTGDSLVVGGGAVNVYQDLPNGTYRVTVVGYY